jgi:hypothetical protein
MLKTAAQSNGRKPVRAAMSKSKRRAALDLRVF